jgi:hypothetical protein
MNISGDLLRRIHLSSVWQQPTATTIVWITMILMADDNGFVDAMAPGIAMVAHTSLEECEAALNFLASPDGYSECVDDDSGRRIVRKGSGWQIIDSRIRASARQDRRRIQNRDAQRRFREGKAS